MAASARAIGGVVLRQLRVELGAVEARQHLAGLHDVAVLGVEFDDGQAVDARRDLRLLARDERARDEQAVDEFRALGRATVTAGGSISRTASAAATVGADRSRWLMQRRLC